MIQIRFEEREKIGLQYILESLHGCSPFGQERIRRLRYYTPDERQELEQELRNVERAAAGSWKARPVRPAVSRSFSNRGRRVSSRWR